MKNAYDFIWDSFSYMFSFLEKTAPREGFGRDFDFDKVSEEDKRLIKELAQRMAFVLYFSEDEDGKEAL